jgi:hypothetical protein
MQQQTPMKLFYQTYEGSSPLEPREAFERIERLLKNEGVEYITSGLRVASTSTPIVMLGFQPKLYTRKNWVGLNPFAFITSVDIQCELADDATARIKVRINRRRSILHVVFWGACGALMAQAMPEPAGVLLFGVMIFAAWFSIVKYLGGRLVKREIMDELGAHPVA